MLSLSKALQRFSLCPPLALLRSRHRSTGQLHAHSSPPGGAAQTCLQQQLDPTDTVWGGSPGGCVAQMWTLAGPLTPRTELLADREARAAVSTVRWSLGRPRLGRPSAGGPSSACLATASLRPPPPSPATPSHLALPATPSPNRPADIAQSALRPALPPRLSPPRDPRLPAARGDVS